VVKFLGFVLLLWIAFAGWAEYECPWFLATCKPCSVREGCGPLWFYVMMTSPVAALALIGLVM
jgi:hypothetical protein